MAIYLSDILKKPTVDEQTASWVRLAQAAGIKTSLLSSKSPLFAMARSVIGLTDYLWTRIVTVGQQLTNLYSSEGQWLEVLAEGFYDTPKAQATTSVGSAYVIITTSSVSSVVLIDTETGVTFTAPVSTYTLDTNGVYNPSLSFTASQAGTIGNSSIENLSVQSPTSGVVLATAANSTINSTQYNYNSLSGVAWLSSGSGNLGADSDTDDSLRVKCLDKLALASTGSHSDCLAARVRAATGGAIDQVCIVPSRSVDSSAAVGAYTVYYASSNTNVSPDNYNSLVTQTVDLYFGAESSPTVVRAPTDGLYMYGTLYITAGSSASDAQRLLSDLQNWVAQQPICNGTGDTILTTWDVVNALTKTLDTGNIVAWPQIYIAFPGSLVAQNLSLQNLQSPLPNNTGNIIGYKYRLNINVGNSPSGGLKIASFPGKGAL